jgi:hypothetical protein
MHPPSMLEYGPRSAALAENADPMSVSILSAREIDIFKNFFIIKPQGKL